MRSLCVQLSSPGLQAEAADNISTRTGRLVLKNEFQERLHALTWSQTFLPARMALPGCVSLALPAGAAAAARHRGLWNGLTNPGCPDMTIKLSAFFFF